MKSALVNGSPWCRLCGLRPQRQCSRRDNLPARVVSCDSVTGDLVEAQRSQEATG